MPAPPTITPSKYISPQKSGPYAQTLAKSILYGYQNCYDQTINYWEGLTLDDWQSGAYSYYWNNLFNNNGIQASELYFIGQLVGVPWPSAPTGTLGSQTFTFNTVYSPDNNPLEGFSSFYDPVPTGDGQWPSVYGSTGSYIPANYYVLLLQIVAYFKWNGLTIYTLDQAANMVWSGTHTINYTVSTDYDIDITLNSVGNGSLAWILQTALSYFYVNPTVTVLYT